MVSEVLRNAVIKQSGGLESWNEDKQYIAEGQIMGGFHGWIYYHETCAFTEANEIEIKKLLNEKAEEFGISSAEMLSNFNCLNDVSVSEAEQYLMGLMGDDHELHTSIQNALAWFAAEETARAEVNR